MFLDEWNSLYQMDLAWMDVAREIMKVYVLSVEGSFIEEKHSGLVWRFEAVHPDFGTAQAISLEGHLKVLMEKKCKVDIFRGKNYVEVRPTAINKVRNFLTHLPMGKSHIPLPVGEFRQCRYEEVLSGKGSNRVPVMYRRFLDR